MLHRVIEVEVGEGVESCFIRRWVVTGAAVCGGFVVVYREYAMLHA